MKSFWTVQYNGKDVRCFLEKLEHRLAVTLIDAKHETSGACPEESWIEFYVEHPGNDWQEVLFQTLLVAQRLSRGINIAGDAREMLIGTAVVAAEARVPGLVGCAWRLKLNQDYRGLEMIQVRNAA